MQVLQDCFYCKQPRKKTESVTYYYGKLIHIKCLKILENLPYQSDPNDIEGVIVPYVGRIYYHEQLSYPSVTTILQFHTSEGISRWKANNPDWKEDLRYYQIRGELGHFQSTTTLAKAANLKPPKYTLPKEDLRWAMNYPKFDLKQDLEFIRSFFEDFIRDYQPKAMRVEDTLISSKYRYAGTLDLFVVIEDQAVLLDLKTSPEVKDSYAMQLAAYKEMLEGILEEVDKCAILNLCPDFLIGRGTGKYEFTYVEPDMDGFIQQYDIFKENFPEYA